MDDLEQQVEDQFPEPEAPVENEVPSPSSDTDHVDEPRSPSTFEVDGRELSEDQLRVALRFNDWTQQHPEQFNKIVEWEKAGYDPSVFTPQQQTQQPTEEELDVYSEDYLKGLNQRLSAFEAEAQNRSKREGEYAVQEGIQQFLGSHQDLSQQDAEQVFSWVHQNQLLRSIPENTPVGRVPTEVAARFEAGYRNVFFERAQNNAATKIVSDQQKRRRAASTSSSAATAPRTPAEPSTPQERRQLAVDLVAEAMAENP